MKTHLPMFKSLHFEKKNRIGYCNESKYSFANTYKFLKWIMPRKDFYPYEYKHSCDKLTSTSLLYRRCIYSNLIIEGIMELAYDTRIFQ